jgi:hypothetical protein
MFCSAWSGRSRNWGWLVNKISGNIKTLNRIWGCACCCFCLGQWCSFSRAVLFSFSAVEVDVFKNVCVCRMQAYILRVLTSFLFLLATMTYHKIILFRGVVLRTYFEMCDLLSILELQWSLSVFIYWPNAVCRDKKCGDTKFSDLYNLP